MKSLRQLLFLACLCSLAGCSEDDGRRPPASVTAVRLEGSIGAPTRAVIGSGYEKELPVCFVRQDETSDGTYGAWRLCPATRNGGRGNRPILFAAPQWYPADGSRTRLQGYYPAVDEAAFDTGTGIVTFTVDGKTDIMATGLLTASASAPAVTCTFRHLLTQVAPACYSDCAEQWGTVLKIEAAGIVTGRQLDCRAETPQLTALSQGTAEKVAVQDIDGLSLPAAEEDGGPPEAQGYILLPASEGTPASPLQLEVTTTKDGRGNETETVTRVAVSVEGGFLAGKRHVVSLFFTRGMQINVLHVGVKAWTDLEAGELPI